MKLVRVDHWRCGEVDGYTYLWAPDNVDENQFDSDIAAAAAMYIEAKKAFLERSPMPPYTNLHDIINNCSKETTVGDALNKLEVAQKKREEWNSLERETTKSFGSYMRKLGYIPLGWEDEDDDTGVICSDVSWGHRHGQVIDYTRTHTDYTPNIDDDPHLL